jgi:hypothetical protein
MKMTIRFLLVGLGLTCASSALFASTLTFDSTELLEGTGYSTSYSPGHSATVNGITASAYYFDSSSGTWKDANLWVRNEAPNDLGLGVCSPGESYCSPSNYGQYGNGDSNELSDEVNQEVIVMERPAGYQWSDLVVSSMDSGGTNGAESGTMYWSSDSIADIDTFLKNTLTGGNPDQLAFSYGTDASHINVNGDVLGLPGAGAFDPNSKYVVFTSGSGSQISGMLGGSSSSSTCKTGGWSGTNNYGGSYDGGSKCPPPTPLNNDYLVWSGVVNFAPEPGTLALMGAGLAWLARWRRHAGKG